MSIDVLFIVDNPKHDKYYHGEDWSIKPVLVLDETTKSYIVQKYGRQLKVNKKTLLGTPNYSGISEQFFLSEEDAKDFLWLHNNKYEIIEKLKRSNSIKIFKYISEQLGDKK